MDVPVVPHEIHYSSTLIHKCTSIQIPMYIHIHRYVHLKCTVCKDAVGQTQEKRHLGCESSGTLVCTYGNIKQYTERWNRKQCTTILFNTQVME